MTSNRGLRCASFGSSSVNVRPGVLVSMVANGPRYSEGASGFGSNMSMWLGAPQSQTNRIDLARPRGLAATGRAEPATPRAAAVDVAARRNERRVIPPQVRARKRPISSMPSLIHRDAAILSANSPGGDENAGGSRGISIWLVKRLVVHSPADGGSTPLPNPLPCNGGEGTDLNLSHYELRQVDEDVVAF